MFILLYAGAASTTSSPWKLFCQAVDYKNQRLGSFFSVYIATSADLKKAIFKELPRDGWKQVAGFNATDLGLWKLSNPISTEKDAIYYQTAFASLDFSNPEWDDENPDDTSEVRLLNPLYEISECWGEEPPEECIHLVLRVPRVDAGV